MAENQKPAASMPKQAFANGLDRIDLVARDTSPATPPAISRPEDLVFGTAARPVVCGFDVHIGDGQVLPEVNFTLPAILIEAATWPDVVAHYDEMAKAILRRAATLRVPGIVLEFELLPAMTATPEWGAEIT